MTGSLKDDLKAVQRISAMPSILQLAAQTSHMGFVGMSRITSDHWIACAVHDVINQGLRPGDEVDIANTICGEVRGQRRATIIDDVAADPIYHNHPAPKIFNFRSYISVPVVRADGSFFGSLFAIERAPVKLGNSPAGAAFNLLARLIALELDGAPGGGRS